MLPGSGQLTVMLPFLLAKADMIMRSPPGLWSTYGVW